MAGHAPRHRAQKRPAAAANVFESFAVAVGALSVVALMTFIAGGPASLDGSVRDDPGGSKVSSGTGSTPQGASTSGPWAPAGPLSTSPADVSGAFPAGVPTPQTSADAATPASPPTSAPGSAASPATPADPATPTTAVRPTRPVTTPPWTTPGKPTTLPTPVGSGKPSFPGIPPVTPGIPPGSQPGPTP
jgi:hypothetical protein